LKRAEYPFIHNTVYNDDRSKIYRNCDEIT